MRIQPRFFILCSVLMSALCTWPAAQASIFSTDEAWERWRPAADSPTIEVDHDPWARLLRNYLDDQHPSGINRFAYARVTDADRQQLQRYIDTLVALPVPRLTPLQQQAYWVNLYNAITVKVILENPDVASIRRIKSGWLTPGPWDLELVEIDGVALTLNDIEHRILRPIYADARVHFAVNCASLGCPNLAAEPFRASTLEQQYDAAAREFINHPRGANVSDGTLTLSSIFKWYGDDFGENVPARLQWISRYAEPELAAQLERWQGRINYDYDWRLNRPE
tara:strand:+ start:105155 stop:105994 length:840 start_codon:yes stop_codon:yes gene_type:complete